jgi:isoamylase
MVNSKSMKVLPGNPYPLGARYDGNGVNFAIFSELAERVELCLFEDDGRETRINIPDVSAYVWHTYLSAISPGQRYGYRVYGPWEPPRGHRCCPTKLLLDPYCKAVEGAIQWSDAMYPYRPGQPEGTCSTADNAALTHKSVVINPYFDWRKEHRPNIPLEDTIIYEVHVKGFTKRHPAVPADLRGTYAGLAHPAIIDYLKGLGITAVELMPVHQFVHDRQLVDKGLRNYWGYNSICYFAPHNEYCSTGQHRGQQVQEFKQMVHDLHEAGIEVILDVVYNHTAEGNHLGPMLCYKGIDNPAYYRLVDKDPQHYMDFTGTGNSLNMRHPHVLQLVMDSLRYWITEMHVDGFRFDLAATLARELKEVDRLSAFFDVIQQDPIISQVKLIAEPWDVAEGGYQVGKFPPLWSEWNGIYRDTIRDYWRAQGTTLGQLASRFTGSSDLYENTGRRPHASVNFVTAHDGFTLHDLVTYNEKHNEANLEDNKDGTDDNRSWNCGVEGETDDPAINDLRDRQKRNFLATLLLSQGIPMLRGGDEISQTRKGNNNAYCQDNETSWYDWEHVDEELKEFTSRLIQLRQEHPVFRRRGWFQGRSIRGTGTGDIGWFRPDGVEMVDEDWKGGFYKSLQVFLLGELGYVDRRGEPVVDDDFLILFNAHWEDAMFRLALAEKERPWQLVLDTSARPEDGAPRVVELPEAEFRAEGRSMAVFSRPRKQEE